MYLRQRPHVNWLPIGIQRRGLLAVYGEPERRKRRRVARGQRGARRPRARLDLEHGVLLPERHRDVLELLAARVLEGVEGLRALPCAALRGEGAVHCCGCDG